MKSIVIAVASLCLVSQSRAESDHPELTAADQAYSAGQYELAASLYRRDAELGVVAAQLNLAFLFLDGQGVDQDYAAAATWFQRAAEQGSSEAQQNLGVLYREGKGVPRQPITAAKWFRLAGDSLSAAAMEKVLAPPEAAEVSRLVSEFRAHHPAAPRH